MRTVIVALILSMAGGQAAQAVALPDKQLSEIAAREAAAAAEDWNLPIKFVAANEVSISSHPSGEIRASVRALGGLLAGLPDDRAEAVIGWVMAHEVWHQAQYRAGFKLTAPDSAKRLFECEADVMATHNVINRKLRTNQSVPTNEAAQELASDLRQIMATLERLEAGFAGVLRHPPGHARMLAIRAGAGRAVYERLYDLAPDAESGFVRDGLGKLHDIRTDEPIRSWATRTCRLALHESDGAADLVLGRPIIQWNASGDPPIVDYSLPFRNRGESSIRVTMQIRTASVPRTNRDDMTRWTFADATSYAFQLEPGETYRVVGRLDWYATDEVMPRLLYPGSEGSLYDAVRVAGSRAEDAAQRMMPLSPELELLKGGLQSIYNDSSNRFRTVGPPCTREDVDDSCPLMLRLPGVISAEVSRYEDGSSDVYLLIFEGESEAAAASAYQAFQKKLLRMYPTATFDQRSSSDTREQTVLQPAPRADLRLVKRRRDKGEYVVSAVITPKLD